ncbi:hypothetical protein CC86DRAFT_386696 [Ophiobolus disseminans]|uniref:Heterokaryon incompatibility domain-containing protein n=1 Tax=Ophiobolus disseminans TaxID=1469910 RepID=A0A6A6ZJE2_9PLEO|nr:hypothetical protein CC86DRAFT_386696 [Ophiobolus disseminans]
MRKRHAHKIQSSRQGRADSTTPITASGSYQPPSEDQVTKAVATPYQYRSLSSSTDCIRLVKIYVALPLAWFLDLDTDLPKYPSHDPRAAWRSLLTVNLEHHAMGDLVGNHTFDAVSYVWGTSVRDKKVLSDDCTSYLSVTPSLHEVLSRLATQPTRVPYWIDGICINQEDAEERGAQVQKMAKIYRRAERVHISLGGVEVEGEELLASAWFTRQWIIQEAIAAQKVLCMLELRLLGINSMGGRR